MNKKTLWAVGTLIVIFLCVLVIASMHQKNTNGGPAATSQVSSSIAGLDSGVVESLPDSSLAISNISVSTIATSSVVISWETNTVAGGYVEYGSSESYGSETPHISALATNHETTISGLTPATEYHFRVKVTDGSGNVVVTSGDNSFSTSPESHEPGSETDPTVISDVRVHDVRADSVHVSWLTDKAANSQVRYIGENSREVFFTDLDPTLSLTHDQLLTSLSSGIRYHFVVLSQTEAGVLSTSDEYFFTALAEPSGGASPVISNVQTQSIASTSATIIWKTDVPASSRIDYGLTSAYGASTESDSTLLTEHRQTVTGLIPNTLYHFRAVSEDVNAQTSYSIDTTFTTTSGTGEENPPLAIQDLRASSVNATSFVLTWTAPNDDTGVVSYDINRSDSPMDEGNFYAAQVVHETVITVDDVDHVGTTRSYKVVGLTPGSAVYIAIKSSDPYGNVSPISNVVLVTTLSGGYKTIGYQPGVTTLPRDMTPPAKVTDVQAAGLDKLIFLSWKNPVDTDFTRVRIMRSTVDYPSSPDSGYLAYDGKGMVFSDPNLVNGKTYYYSIFTYDTALNYSVPVQLAIAPYAERRHYHILNVDTVSSTPTKLSGSADIRLGDWNDEVGHIQEILATDPTLYPEGLITNYFGPLTMAAVKNLQRRAGVQQTGVVDAGTRTLLKNLPVKQALNEVTTPCFTEAFAHDISFGACDENVKTLQTFLSQHTYLSPDLITGYFGNLTKQAVMNFQRDNGISPTGYVGPLTRAKILESF